MSLRSKSPLYWKLADLWDDLGTMDPHEAAVRLVSSALYLSLADSKAAQAIARALLAEHDRMCDVPCLDKEANWLRDYLQ